MKGFFIFVAVISVWGWIYLSTQEMLGEMGFTLVTALLIIMSGMKFKS
jgi:hypothetical protein